MHLPLSTGLPGFRILCTGCLVFLITFSGCLPKKDKSDLEKLQIASNKATDRLSGKELAALYCATCHMYPSPDLLSRENWGKKVLPQMGARMGIREALRDPYKGMTPADKMVVKNAGIFPDRPMISDLQWDKIKIFYFSQSPQKLPGITRKISPDTTSGLFDFQPVTLDLPRGGLTTLIRQNPFSKQYFIGDSRNLMIVVDHDFNLVKRIDMPSPPLDIEFISDKECWITCVGILHPNEQHLGQLIRLDSAWRQTVLISNLGRPVYTRPADLNDDGQVDLIISEYGNNIGELAWYENIGSQQFTRHILRNYPGSIQSYTPDINNDGKPDIISLFAQADEGIYTFINEGNGEFSGERTLRFPPVYGSSYFNLADFNNDGFPDIMYVNGDNADYSFELKPYHGVRIFLNDGKNHYNESYFFPMYGASYGDVFDFDSDGDEDMVILSFFPDMERKDYSNIIYLENSGGTPLSFRPWSISDGGTGRWIIADKSDYDTDNDTDLLLGSFTFSPAPTPLQLRRDWYRENVHIGILRNHLRDILKTGHR